MGEVRAESPQIYNLPSHGGHFGCTSRVGFDPGMRPEMTASPAVKWDRNRRPLNVLTLLCTSCVMGRETHLSELVCRLN